MNSIFNSSFIKIIYLPELLNMISILNTDDMINFHVNVIGTNIHGCIIYTANAARDNFFVKLFLKFPYSWKTQIKKNGQNIVCKPIPIPIDCLILIMYIRLFDIN